MVVILSSDGQRDVKVFVDLALNYVGDNPIDMDKVRNFQQVIAGYAPLIFQSAGDTETFLGRCRKVFDNVEVDPMLPAKLVSMRLHISINCHFVSLKTKMPRTTSCTRTHVLCNSCLIGVISKHSTFACSLY